MPDEQQAAPFQRETWDRMAATYRHEEDPRFAPAVNYVIARATLRPGDDVLDLGTGTGSVALKAAGAVGPSGSVLAVDLSPEMLRVAAERAAADGVTNVTFREGAAQAIPAPDSSVDVLTLSLCLMFVPDRATAARECARVLRPGGRFVASVFGPPERADLPRLQQIIGRFAPKKPPPGTGPSALADPSEFLRQLGDAGIEANAVREVFEFTFMSLDQAYAAATRVTAASMPPELEPEIKAAIQAEMWPDPASPRVMRQELVLISGRRV